ncbi:MAG: imidazole glycerol phosphate synthase subunit HisH [Betaproteobacteria bacterium]|nr:imidazole glycerol phosphate synthase subunit HisH [Betaproteobacteria bacterium]
MKVGIINYGIGNIGSVTRALGELHANTILISRATDVKTVDRLILPGVGSFADCARLLNEGGWVTAIQNEVLVTRKPLLGICLGMQLLATTGTEGASKSSSKGIAGLGLIPGRVESLRNLGCKLRVPHVGWNEVNHTTSDTLFDGIPNGTDFYFVHSYAFVPDEPSNVLATTVYDIPVTTAVRHGHIFGVQFHPEKSSRAGFRLLKNFIAQPAC